MIFVSLSGALIIVVIVVGVAIAAVTFVVDIKERESNSLAIHRKIHINVQWYTVSVLNYCINLQ